MVEREYVEINNVFAIVKMDEGDFILAEVKIDKETKRKILPDQSYLLE